MPEVATMLDLGLWSKSVLQGRIKWVLGLVRPVMVPSATVGQLTM